MEKRSTDAGSGAAFRAPTQVVHSPEQYRLDLPLAGPASRIFASAIDWLLPSR